jgi:hypothetical protein
MSQYVTLVPCDPPAPTVASDGPVSWLGVIGQFCFHGPHAAPADANDDTAWGE